MAVGISLLESGLHSWDMRAETSFTMGFWSLLSIKLIQWDDQMGAVLGS